jgi:hypothetical protein
VQQIAAESGRKRPIAAESGGERRRAAECGRVRQHYAAESGRVRYSGGEHSWKMLSQSSDQRRTRNQNVRIDLEAKCSRMRQTAADSGRMRVRASESGRERRRAERQEKRCCKEG